MIPENYPKCRTCRHYSEGGEFIKPFGYCEKIQDEDEGKGIAYVSPCHDFGAIFHPHPDFGCSLHSELETDQQKGEG